MNQLKYIIVDQDGIEIPVIFPQFLKHDQMLAKIGGKIVSAGFVMITPKGVKCYGDSTSLMVRSRANDSKIINEMGDYDYE